MHNDESLASNSRGDDRVVASRKVKQVYLEDGNEVWFQDDAERFWIYEIADQRLTELIPKEGDGSESIPTEVWQLVGELLGLLLIRRESCQ